MGFDWAAGTGWSCWTRGGASRVRVVGGVDVQVEAVVRAGAAAGRFSAVGVVDFGFSGGCNGEVEDRERWMQVRRSEGGSGTSGSVVVVWLVFGFGGAAGAAAIAWVARKASGSSMATVAEEKMADEGVDPMGFAGLELWI